MSNVTSIEKRTPEQQEVLDRADFVRDARQVRKGIQELRDHPLLFAATFSAGQLMTIHDHLTDAIKSLESAVCHAERDKC